jgi:hypothetical protein
MCCRVHAKTPSKAVFAKTKNTGQNWEKLGACADPHPDGTSWPLQLCPQRKKPKEIIGLNLGEGIAHAAVHCFLRSRTCLQ